MLTERHGRAAVTGFHTNVSTKRDTRGGVPEVSSVGELAPAGAIHLLGADLAAWTTRDEGEPGWRFDGGVLEVVPGAGDLMTRHRFKDFQLHLEFWLPPMPEARGQERANSGVFLDGRYELQILDSAGGPVTQESCGAIYGIAPPLHDASLPPGHWQSFDIALRSRRGDVPPLVTAFQNGVLIHNAVGLVHETPGALGDDTSEARPLVLQDHGAPVQFRNIWALEQES